MKKDATCGGEESRREKEIDRATHAQHERCALKERAACDLEGDAAWLEEERGSTNRVGGRTNKRERKLGEQKEIAHVQLRKNNSTGRKRERELELERESGKER